MNNRNQMTIYLNDIEMSVIEQISDRVEEPKSVVVRKMLREYYSFLQKEHVIDEHFILTPTRPPKPVAPKHFGRSNHKE